MQQNQGGVQIRAVVAHDAGEIGGFPAPFGADAQLRQHKIGPAPAHRQGVAHVDAAHQTARDDDAHEPEGDKGKIKQSENSACLVQVNLLIR